MERQNHPASNDFGILTRAGQVIFEGQNIVKVPLIKSLAGDLLDPGRADDPEQDDGPGNLLMGGSAGR